VYNIQALHVLKLNNCYAVQVVNSAGVPAALARIATSPACSEDIHRCALSCLAISFSVVDMIFNYGYAMTVVSVRSLIIPRDWKV
jgi:hypothetical protein